MRMVFSFFLSLLIYFLILSFFVYIVVFDSKPKKPKVVYVHQAILNYKTSKIAPKIRQKITKTNFSKQKSKTIKTKSSFSKGGKDSLDDIFANVSDNVPTSRIKQKKHSKMTKKYGSSDVKNILKELTKIKKQVSLNSVAGDKKSANQISNIFANIWAQIQTSPGDFVRLSVVLIDGDIKISVISTNLDTIRLNNFLAKLKKVNTSKMKNLNVVIDFNVKLKENR